MKKEKVISVCSKHGETEHYLCSYKTKEENELKCIACYEEVVKEKRKQHSKIHYEQLKNDPAKHNSIKEYGKEYREQHLEEIKQKQKEHYCKNREKQQAYARAYKKIRMSDANAYKHDREYTKRWNDNNIDHVRDLARINSQRKMQLRIENIEKFLSDNRLIISTIVFKLKSSLSFTDIKNHCIRFNITNIDKVKNYIICIKKAKLLKAEEWKQSTLSKYHHGVIEHKNEYLGNYKIKGKTISHYDKIDEEEKVQIRNDYKTKAKNIVNKKMNELCTGI